MQRRAEQLHDQRTEAAKAADRLQLKISEAEAEIGKMKDQMNVTKHQKEYDKLKTSILSHEADIQKWEDEALEAFSSVDELEEEAQKAAEQIEEARAELERIQESVAEEQKAFDTRIEELEEELADVRDSVKPSVLSAYKRLAGSRLKQPLATVRNRVCEGCFTQLTKQTEVLLRRDDEIVYCNSCGRMLVIED
jgi:predicted  nucleic acid-binding Zn-ribbon protein